MSKVRWGVLSTANIGVKKVIPAMLRGNYCDMIGIASRNLEQAQATASKLGLPKAYGSYEDLLADPEIDAIYNPLPNHLHIPWSIKALDAGKHVLCEKPISLNAAQAQQLVDAAAQHPHLKVMEAFMYRFHPQWQRARELVRDGRIGELRTIQTIFSYYLDDATNIRNSVEAGGGALYDIGCYPISISRFIFGTEPRRVSAIAEFDPRFGTDRLTSAILDFGSGSATFTCGTQLSPYQRVTILGTQGYIEVEIPVNAPPDRSCRIWLQQGNDERQEILLPVADQYTLQGDAFSRAILDNTDVPTPITDAIANMRVIDAVFQSARTNSWA